MTVVHISTSDRSGGAARAAHRLHRGLCGIGVDSSMYVRRKASQNENVRVYDASPSVLQRLRDRVVRRWLSSRFSTHADTRPEGLELFSQARTVDGARVVRQLPAADIYNLHWVNHGFIDPLPFFRSTQQPIVWTLHDMNPFTGGCHYSAGCRRFEDQCGSCPQLGSTDDADLSRTVWTRKHRAYEEAIRDDRLHIVSPSEWLASEARASSLFQDAPVHVIPYGVDITTFRPRDSEGMRRALAIPPEHRILLFVADYSTRRKGFDVLTSALESVEAEDVTLLSIGDEQPDMETALPHQHLGRIESDLLLSVFYSLADLFVIPSRQDNLPNTVLESMACGTPVVGFDTGGIPDMVRPGETGWLAEPESVRSLRNAIHTALSEDSKRQQRGTQARAVVEDEYTLEVQARRYRDLHEQLSNQNEATG